MTIPGKPVAPAHCIWITGLSGAGKSTLAAALRTALLARGVAATVLDGDDLRKGLCADLGLSETDRDENIRRAGEVARLMQRAGLVVICAFISPYAAARERVRQLFDAEHFTEIFLSTSLAVCAARDPKGLYARARSGALSGLTGWDAPYEKPDSPDFTFDTEHMPLGEMVAAVLGPPPR
jgi:adenylyl-sulfate kinase